MSIKYWIQHNHCRIITAVVFCLVFSLLAFAPPLSTTAHAIALADDAIFLILAALLASSGILLVSDSSGSVTDFLQGAVNDFCADVGESWDTIKSSFKFGVDKLGNILTDNSVLSFFGRFSDWMTRFYSLSDNTDSTISGSVLPYLPLADGGVFTITVGSPHLYGGSSLFYNNQTVTFANGTTLTLVAPDPNHNNWAMAYVNGVAYDIGQGNAVYGWIGYRPDTGRYTVSGTDVSNPPVGTYAQSTKQLPVGTFGDYLIPSGSVVTADCGVIDIPVDGTDYTDEDGAVIGGIGSWGDSWNELLEKLREWLDAQSSSSVADPTLVVENESEIAADIETDLLSTDNWPGMIPPSVFPEFSFSSIWHYVTDWLAAFSGTLATVLGISFALPAVSIVYAVVVLSLTLWLLRKVSS